MLSSFVCAGGQLPRGPDRALAEVELWGPPAWSGRRAVCTALLCPPWGHSPGRVKPLALWRGWGVLSAGSLLPVMASFSKALLSLLTPREGSMTQTQPLVLREPTVPLGSGPGTPRQRPREPGGGLPAVALRLHGEDDSKLGLEGQAGFTHVHNQAGGRHINS